MKLKNWRVLKNCKFVGYVVANSMKIAKMKALEKYGQNCWVELYFERIV